MRLLQCSWLECWCSAATLTLPKKCGKSVTQCISGIITSPSPLPHPWTTLSTAKTNHMRLTRCSSYCMQQSAFCDRGASPGHPTMDKNHKKGTDEAASYHASTHAHLTWFYTAPYVPSPSRPTHRLTSKVGHSKSSRHPNTNTTTIHCNSR